MFIYGRKSINGSVKRLSVPALSCGAGVVWNENIFVPNSLKETEVTTKLGLWKLALDLVSTAWMAGLMNNGYNFLVETPFVVQVAEIMLVA